MGGAAGAVTHPSRQAGVAATAAGLSLTPSSSQKPFSGTQAGAGDTRTHLVKGALHALVDGPGVGEEEVARQLHPRQQLAVPHLRSGEGRAWRLSSGAHIGGPARA